MDIKFEDYLSEDERKEIIKGVFHAKCLEAFDKGAERIFSNAAYHVVYQIIDGQHDGNVAEIIAKKAISVIENLSDYSVFRPSDPWGNKQSKAYDVLMESIEKARPNMEARIGVLIDELDENDIRESLKDVAHDLLDEKLFRKVA
jgi:hypothetical protein